MIIYLLDKNKITKFKLPEKIDDLYILSYYPENSIEKVLINIEKINNDLFIKNNGSVNVLERDINTNKKFEEYNILTAMIVDTKETIYLYYKPLLETKFSNIPLQKDKYTIGSGDNCDIIYKKNNTLNVQAEIIKSNNNYFIQSINNSFIYLNSKRILNTKLKLGDSIFINGLTITFMGNFLRISNPLNEVYFREKLARLDIPTRDNTKYIPLTDGENNLKLYEDYEYFFHTPYRRCPKIKVTIL